MQAAIYKSYGPPEVLQLAEIAAPTLRPEDGERVLIKVYSASVNPYDYLHRKGFLPVRMDNGWFTPKQQIMGLDVAGTIEAVGPNAHIFKVGDRVFGSCVGAHAEYVRVRQNLLCPMPNNLSFHEAAAIPTAGLTALQALRDVAHIQRGQRVLIIGAAGGIGHLAVQFARYYEADVTAVCSTANLGWVKDLGAQTVLDYTQGDYLRTDARYDLIFDAVGARTYASCKRALIASPAAASPAVPGISGTPTGLYISENPLKPSTQLLQFLFALLMRDARFKTHLAQPSGPDLAFMRTLIEAGQLRPVVEKVYPLAQIAAAHRHVEGGHTKGKVVVEVRKE